MLEDPLSQRPLMEAYSAEIKGGRQGSIDFQNVTPRFESSNYVLPRDIKRKKEI